MVLDLSIHKKYIRFTNWIKDDREYNLPELDFYFVLMVYNERRYNFIKKQVEKHNIRAKIFHAVNGCKIDLQEAIAKGYFQEELEMKRQGEWGCALSHLLLWEYMVARKKPFMIVLEDDVELDDDFCLKIKEYLENIPKDFEISQLLHHKKQEWTLKDKRLKTDNPKVLKGIPMYGTVGYIISYEGAKKLIKHSKPLKYPIDVQIWRCIERRLIKAYIPAEKIIHMPYHFSSMVKYEGSTQKYCEEPMAERKSDLKNIASRISQGSRYMPLPVKVPDVPNFVDLHKTMTLLEKGSTQK
jgi:glycosyl transferase family 25